MSIYIVDVETSRLKAGEVIQTCFQRVRMNAEGEGRVAAETPELRHFMPRGPMELGALAAHHLTKTYLAKMTDEFSESARLPEDCAMIIGHGVDFDWEALGKADVYRVCTLALARAVWPKADSFKLAALVYGILGDAARDTLLNSHHALVDVSSCLVVLEQIILLKGYKSFSQLYEASEVARVPVLMPFGKHAGERICELDLGYKSWCLKNIEDLDPYLRKALEAK